VKDRFGLAHSDRAKPALIWSARRGSPKERVVLQVRVDHARAEVVARHARRASIRQQLIGVDGAPAPSTGFPNGR